MASVCGADYPTNAHYIGNPWEDDGRCDFCAAHSVRTFVWPLYKLGSNNKVAAFLRPFVAVCADCIAREEC